MKKFWEKYKKVLILLIVWRVVLSIVEFYSPSLLPLHPGYNGPIPWANHDGIYYLRIAQFGYFHLSQAFFPFYPIVIWIITQIIPLPYWFIGSGLSLICFVVGILFLYRILYEEDAIKAWHSVLFIVAFPTSFFFSAVYPTGLFFLLCILTYYCVKKKLWFWCGVFGALASATRVVGVALLLYAGLEYIYSKPKKHRLLDVVSLCLMPVGLLGYMLYLYIKNGDPLLFFHMQPLFGANRSTTLILLPQVFYRYGKIVFTAFLQPTPLSYFISVIELFSTILGYSLLWYGYKIKQRWSELLFCFVVLTIPTLTGTFSSMPRYFLNAFPLFFILGRIDKTFVRYSLLVIFVILQVILSAMFLRGWFVA
jgi:Gpi18-like mannosyltransferase